MRRRALVIILLSSVLLAFVFAGTKIVLQISGKKVDITARNESRDPYLYNPRLREIQVKLNKVLSFNLTNYAPIEESGFYNKETEAAIEKFREMYYKKYGLQRYYAFSAGESAGPSSVEGLLDREVPAAADFAREYQEGMKLKNGDPAKYYGNSAWDEVRRIEKGMDGDTVDPVTGELSKTIPLYQTPAGNDHLMPIQLSARYGSQYAGNCGLGDGWYLTENYSIWYSYEKNELIVQDGSGVSQKFTFDHTNRFTRGADGNTDGGLFLNVILDGALGSEGSRILVMTARGEALTFECVDKKGQDTVSNVIASIDSSSGLLNYGYSVVMDTRTYETTNIAGGKTNIKTENYGPVFKKGLYAEAANIINTNSPAAETLTGGRMVCGWGEFRGRVNALSDSPEGGWTVNYYAAPAAGYRTNVITNIFNMYISSFDAYHPGHYVTKTNITTSVIIVYQKGQSYSFRRQAAGQANVYAGYVLVNSVNRFGSSKEYKYNDFQKLEHINSYSPGGMEIDSAQFAYSPEGEKGALRRITAGLTGPSNITIAFGYSEIHGDHRLMDAMAIALDGKSYVHRMDYQYELLFGPGSEEGIKLKNSILSNYSMMTNGRTTVSGEIANINANKYNWAGHNMASGILFIRVLTNALSWCPDGLRFINMTITNNKEYNFTVDYFDLLVQFMAGQLPDFDKNISNLTEQINSYNAGDLFPRLALLDFHSESGGQWQEYRYSSFDTNTFSVTNKESTIRTAAVRKQGFECSFSYSRERTDYRNFSGSTFLFYYDQGLTNYAERRANRIVYPDNSFISLGYDKKGNITAVTNEIGNPYSYAYDDFGNVTVKRVPGGREWNYEYGSVIGRYLGRPTKIGQPDGTFYSMAYDGAGELTNQTLKKIGSAEGKTLVQVFFAPSSSSADGFIKTVRDMSGSETVYTYDRNHSLVKIENPDGGVITYSNDIYGKPLMENRDNKVTNVCVYDSRGNIVEQGINSLKHGYSEYDAAGRRLSSTDPNGNTTRFVYFSGSLPAKVIFPTRDEVRTAYDGDGNKINEAYYSQSGIIIDNKNIIYEYDKRYRLKRKSLVQDGGAFIYSFGYDSAGNMVLQTAASTPADGGVLVSVSSSYTYDAISIMTNQRDLISGKTVSYFYDPMGRLTYEYRTVTNGSAYSLSLSNTYDILGRNTAGFSIKGGETVLLSSNYYIDDKRITVKTDRYGKHSTNYMDFRNNVTNLQYAVFNPLTEMNEAYSHFYIYDTLGNKTEEIYPDGTHQKWMYKYGRPAGESSRYSDENAAVWKTYTLDAMGHVLFLTDFENKTWGKTYNSLGYLSSETDPDGRRIFYSTDLRGNPVTVIMGNRRKDITYNLLNKPIEINYGDGADDTARYDAMGNAVLALPGGGTNLATESRYDAEGRKTYEKGFGLETFLDYDAMGNLTRKKAVSTTPSPLLPLDSAAKQGAVNSGTAEGSRTWTYGYDAYGRLTNEILPDGSSVSHTYGAMNGLLYETVSGPKKNNSAAVNITVNTYDQMDRLIRNQVQDDGLSAACDIPFFAGKGLISGKVFDKAGLPVREIKPGNKIRNYSYSPEGRLTNEENEIGEAKTYAYDKNGNLTFMVNFDGNSFSNIYNGSGKIMKSVEPGNAVTSFYYDPYGNLNKKVLPDGSTWLLETDARGRIVRETNPFGGVTAYEYDALGRKTAETGPGGQEIVYLYDANGLPSGVSTKGNDGESGYTISVSVDGFGETNRVEYPTTPNPSSGKEGSQGLVVIYQYDNMGRVIQKNEGGRVTDYQYREDGRFIRADNPDGTAEIYSYNAAGLLTNRAILGDTTKGGASPKRETAYYYGPQFGDVESVADYRGITTTSYHDNAGRLTNRVESAGGQSRNTITVYGKMKIGDIYCRTIESWKESGNKKTEWSKTVSDFRENIVRVYRMENEKEILETERSYNASGKVILEIRHLPADSVETHSEYSVSGALSKKTEPSGLITECAYDSAGRIIQTSEYSSSEPVKVKRTQYTYHKNGNLKRKAILDFSGSIAEDTSYGYDFRGNVIQKTDNLRKTVFITGYNSYGEKTEEQTFWNGKAMTRQYIYDNAGRLYQTIGELGAVTEYRYGAHGQLMCRLIKAGDGDNYGIKTTNSYNDKGFVISETIQGSTKEGGTDKLKSYTTAYEYDIWGSRTKTIYPDGSFETSEYYPLGQKASETDRCGYKTTYTYDDNGREIKRTQETPNGPLTAEMEYDTAGRKTAEKSYNESTGPQRTVNYSYDSSGRLVRQEISGAAAQTGYDAFGNKIWTADYNGNKSWFQYDAAGRTVVSIDGEGNKTETSYGFEGDGRLTVTTTPNPSSGKEGSQKIVYDGFGNKIEAVDPNGNSEFYQYNAAGKPIVYTDRNGNKTTYIYDSLGRQMASIDPAGGTISNVYDSFNNIIEVVDKENHHLYREFDWTGRMVYTRDALGNKAFTKFTTENTEGTEIGNGGSKGYEVEEFTDSEGNKTTTYRYGKMTLTVSDALGNSTKYQYNAFGEMTATIDPKGNTTTLAYDLRGNKTTETMVLGFKTEYQYDNNGSVILEMNGEGTINTAYSKNNLPVKKTYSDGNTKNFLYDSLGRLTRARDNFSDYSYLYDNNGNLTNRYDNINRETLAYEYDKNGNRIKMIAGGKTVNYKYDSLNQIKNETVWHAEAQSPQSLGNGLASGGDTNLSISYAYSAMGRVTNKTYSSGLKVNYEYDPIYRLTKINNITNNKFLSSFEYLYDKVGNRIREISQEGGKTGSTGNGSVLASGGERVSTFLYDKSYRLVKADYDQGKFEEFEYDSSGNRLKKTSNLEGSNTIMTAYVYDNDNRLLCEQKPSGNISYIYDKAGRLVKKTDGDKIERYQFNQRDLMTKYTVEKGGNIVAVSEMTYDINNLRTVKKETPETTGSVGDTTRFTYDGNDILLEGGTFHLTKVDQRSGYEAEIQPLRIAVHIKDANGSIRGELYDNPITINMVSFTFKTFDYTAFGEQIKLAGAIDQNNDMSLTTVKTGLSFKGHYFDDSSGLYYAVARFYNPDTGRFISPDPIQDPSKRYSPAGLNRYVYGINNPLKYSDPDGQWFFFDDIAALIIGAVVGAINNIITDIASGDWKDILADSILGSVSGAVNFELQHNAIPVYIGLSTRGYSAGVGFGLGGGAFNVGAGFHSDWSGQNYGFSASAGVGMPGGAGFGVSIGADYSRENGWTSSIGANVSLGMTQNSTLNLGASLNFDSEGVARGGFTFGMSERGAANAKTGAYGVMGATAGINIDRYGRASGSFGLTYSHNELMKDSNGNYTKDYMSYNYGYGINISADGKVTPYGNYSASLYMAKQDNAETKKMTDSGAMKKKVDEAKKPYDKYTSMYGRTEMTSEQINLLSDYQRQVQAVQHEINSQLVQEQQNQEIQGKQYAQDVYGGILTEKEHEFQEGNSYKDQMTHFTDDGQEYVSVVIKGVKLSFAKAEFYIPDDSNSTEITGFVDGRTCTNIYYAIKNLDYKTAYYIVEKARAEKWDSIAFNSLWRQGNPHETGRAFDVRAITKNGETVYFNNKIGFVQQYNEHAALVNSVYNAFYNDQKVSQVLNPTWFLSKIPGNSYDEANIWKQQMPIGFPQHRYDLMGQHNNHIHITMYDR